MAHSIQLHYVRSCTHLVACTNVLRANPCGNVTIWCLLSRNLDVAPFAMTQLEKQRKTDEKKATQQGGYVSTTHSGHHIPALPPVAACVAAR